MPTLIGWRSQIPGSNIEDIDEQNPLPVQMIQDAVRASGLNVYSTVILSNVLNLIKPVGPGQIYGWAIYNSSATVPAQIRLYNKGLSTGGVPVIATDTGRIVLRIGVPATTLGAGNNILLPGPIGFGGFSDGIGLSATTAAAGALADTDSSAPASGTLLVNIFWI